LFRKYKYLASGSEVEDWRLGEDLEEQKSKISVHGVLFLYSLIFQTRKEGCGGSLVGGFSPTHVSDREDFRRKLRRPDGGGIFAEGIFNTRFLLRDKTRRETFMLRDSRGPAPNFILGGLPPTFYQAKKNGGGWKGGG
jgi:hypothetical protein